MASVINSWPISDRPQEDGRRYVRYQFVLADHDAFESDVYVGPKLVSSDFDTTADMTALGPILLDRAAQQEIDAGQEMTQIANPLTYALNPKWSTSKAIAKEMIRWLMREQEPRIVIFLEPLIEYLRINYTAEQLQNFLDLSSTQLTKMNRRINAILTDTGTLKNQLAAFETDVEEID